MEAGPDVGFDVEEMKKHLTTRYVGKFIVYKSVTGSTMDDAKQLADTGCPDGGAVLAERQTGGRGQDGHVWHSQDRGNIYVTFVFRKPSRLQNRVGIQDLEFVGSCAVLRAARELGVHGARLKWKNDLWCSGHKLAGALVEAHSSPETSDADGDTSVFLLGIGVNVNSDVRRHPLLRRIATSVRSELGGCIVSREQLFARICHHLETCLEMDRATPFQQMAPFQLFREGSAVNVHNFRDYTKLYSAVIEKIHGDWTCSVRDASGRHHIIGDGVSLRPHPTNSVVVVGGESPALLDSVTSLIDTSSFSVSDIDVHDTGKGHWTSSASLIVMGGKQVSEDAQLDAVQKYVRDGGSLLLIGQAVLHINQWMKDMEITAFSSSERQQHLIKICFKNESASKTWFYNYQSNSVYQISRSIEPVRVLATTEMGETIAGCCAMGKGMVMTVGFDLDITYADIENKDMIAENTVSSLSETVFQRDQFFLQLLKILLTKEMCDTT